MFEYRARIVSIYDGDTLRADVDLGFGVWQAKQKFRLYGINTPEVRGPERADGIRVRDYLRQMIPDGSEVHIRSIRDTTGKYGRYLGLIYLSAADMQNDNSTNAELAQGQGKSINSHLIRMDMAKPYMI